MSGYLNEQQIDHILKLLKRAKRATKDGRINVDYRQKRNAEWVGVDKGGWAIFEPAPLTTVTVTMEWVEKS